MLVGVGRSEGWCQQEAPAAQFALEVRRQTIRAVGAPGRTEPGEQCAEAQHKEKNDDQLQAGLQHGGSFRRASLGGSIRIGTAEFRLDHEGHSVNIEGGPNVAATTSLNADTKAVPDPLPMLSTAELETLLTALDPLLDGFGEGGSCLDDASAYLARLGIGIGSGEGETSEGSSMLQWIERWREAGGNRQTLRLLVTTLLAERQRPGDGGPST